MYSGANVLRSCTLNGELSTAAMREDDVTCTQHTSSTASMLIHHNRSQRQSIACVSRRRVSSGVFKEYLLLLSVKM